MSSKYKTGLKEEALEALPDIIELDNDVLTPHKLAEVNKISILLLGTKREKEIAKTKLILEMGVHLTRPLLYLMPLLKQLSRITDSGSRMYECLASDFRFDIDDFTVLGLYP